MGQYLPGRIGLGRREKLPSPVPSFFGIFLGVSCEGETTEFKIKIPDTDSEKRKLLKTIAAFTNGNGGILIVGVEDKSGSIVGIEGSVTKEKERLGSIIKDRLTSQPNYSALRISPFEFRFS